MGTRRTRRHLVRTALALGLSVVLFFTSGPLATLADLHVGVAFAVPPKPVVGDSGRFVPQMQTPKLPTGTWHPTGPTSRGPKVKNTPGAPSSTGPNPAQGRTPGEQTDMRTANTSTFLNADGTWMLETYAVPVHYQDAQGQWQDIDNTLVPDASDPGYAYGNKADSWHVHFAAQAGGPALTHLQASGVVASETLAGSASVPGTPDGRQMIYAGVFPGVDLLYGLGSVHLEETLLLHDAQGPASYTFTYHVPGAIVTQDAAGNIVLSDAKDGHLLFQIGSVAMVEADAHGNMVPSTTAGEGKVAVTLAGNGPDFSVTLTPDQAWLTNPARHFPVAIDPTIGPLSSKTTTDDTSSGNTYSYTIDEKNNPNLLFYNLNNERIGNCSANPPGLGTGTNRTYIKFPLGTQPLNIHVTYGTLKLYQLSSYAGSTTLIANTILTAWNAKTLDWSNHPTSFSYAGSGTASTTYGVWTSIDVTSAAYAWMMAGVTNNGLEVQYSDETKACDSFASDDYGSDYPSLEIGYSYDTQAPSASLSLNGTYNDGSGHLYTNNPAVSMATTTSDPGATNVWGSNWTSVNGVGPNGFTGASWSVDAAGSQLNASTASCGGTQCWTQSFFTNTISSMSAWPTFTAMFETNTVQNFHFGVISGSNSSTRFTLYAGSSSGFTSLETSTAAGSYGYNSANVPISPNTWYYGQVDFPYPTVGEIRIWPAGQARPSNPTVYATGIYMDHPGLNFFQYGDNGANLHTYAVANVNIVEGNYTTAGAYGVWGMQFSNDNSTYS